MPDPSPVRGKPDSKVLELTDFGYLALTPANRDGFQGGTDFVLGNNHHMTFAEVSLATPLFAVRFHGINDVLHASGGSGDPHAVIRVRLRRERNASNKHPMVCALVMHSVKESINEHIIKERRERAALRHTTVDGERWGDAGADFDAHR